MASKMRDALKELQSRLVAGVYDGSIDCHAALEVVEKALASPRLNCEVGTPDEQNKRFVEYCKNHRIKITGHADACNPECPCRKGGDLNLCTLTWAQMPYEEGDAK